MLDLSPIQWLEIGVAVPLLLVTGYLAARWQESRQRSREFELLAEVGRAVSARLDPDEVLKTIHQELSQLLDTDTFYVAFKDGDRIRFELESEAGQIVPKRERGLTNGFTEHILKTGLPLLIERDLERVRDGLGVVRISRPAKCFCGVPIRIGAEVAGVMAAMSYEKENIYGPHELELMTVAARQLGVSVENARLFAAEQKRAREMAFLNKIAQIAISSQTAEEMMAGIVRETELNFSFDHIGLGVLDYNSKEIEIKAESGNAQVLGKRIPLGVGILGKVARSGEMALEQGSGARLLGVLPEARSVLCMPLKYGESLLGVLNLESRRENAFAPADVLLLQTYSDLVSAALHNVMVFQKMEHQSITDPLTGIKTRRFFSEALAQEINRGQRTGRPFSVVLIDLDKFKEVNDSMGHLEGDLVLARIGRLLEQKVRQSNVVARYGGDEFIILMPETAMDQASILSERLRLWIATDPYLNERKITGSFGVAEYPLHGATAEDVIRVADSSMYISKRAGGNKVSTTEPSEESVAHGEQRQILSSYLGPLLRREHVANTEEIVTALGKIAEAIPTGQPSALRDAVRMINRSVETREMHSSGHGEAVASYARVLGMELQLSPDEMEDLTFAAQVHDVGKITIDERLLNKAGALTFEEYQTMKSHPVAGARILAAVPDSGHAQQYVLHHQERYDGKGYPTGLRGEEVPLGARIIAIAEAYVNMTSMRPYAEARSPGDAMIELEKGAGTQFDGMLVRILVQQLVKGERKH